MQSSLDSPQNKFTPHLALLGVQLMFGAAPTVGKFALAAFPSNAIVAFRVVGAAIAFGLLQMLTGSLKLDQKSDYRRIALYSLLGVVLNQLCFFNGLRLTTATNTSLLAVMIPIFIVIIGAFFGFDKLGWRKVIGILAAACGVIYLIDPTRASFSVETAQGDLIIILNCLFYGTYVAISKDVVKRNGALKTLAWLFLFGSVICLPLGIYSLATVDFAAVSSTAWQSIFSLVVFQTIAAYYLNAWALARVSPATVAVYIYLQPLIGFALAVLYLGENLNSRVFIATLLIFFGVFMVTRKSGGETVEVRTHETMP